jgi:hypothetical protein
LRRLFLVAAFALTAVTSLALPASAGTLDTLITAATPGLVEILGVVLTGLIGWAANVARQKWGIEIEVRHREALQSALLNGARLALARQLTGAAAADLIIGFVRQSVPDALAALRPSVETLEILAGAKLEEAIRDGVQVTVPSVDALSAALANATGRRR